jgi:Ethanolamine utilization protein EutJ (predicted chaperonin)
VASPLLLTFVFVGGGLLMSLVVDDLFGVSRLTFQTYQQSMLLFIMPVAVAVAVATVLSLLIRLSTLSLSSGD